MIFYLNYANWVYEQLDKWVIKMSSFHIDWLNCNILRRSGNLIWQPSFLLSNISNVLIWRAHIDILFYQYDAKKKFDTLNDILPQASLTLHKNYTFCFTLLPVNILVKGYKRKSLYSRQHKSQDLIHVILENILRLYKWI